MPFLAFSSHPTGSSDLYSSKMEIHISHSSMRDVGTAFFLWGLEGPNPNERRFKKRYFTFWNNYNIFMDLFFLVGLIIRTLEYIFDNDEVDISGLSSAGKFFNNIIIKIQVFTYSRSNIVGCSFHSGHHKSYQDRNHLQILRAYNPQYQDHDEGCLHVPDHLLRHHAGLFLWGLLYVQLSTGNYVFIFFMYINKKCAKLRLLLYSV